MRGSTTLLALLIALLGCSTEEQAPALRRLTVDTSKSAAYEAGEWRYDYRIERVSQGSGVGYWGYLYRDGKQPEAGAPLPHGTKLITPWGAFYWVGVPLSVWGHHGWLPHQLARDAWSSRNKPGNWENLKDFQQGAEGDAANRAP